MIPISNATRDRIKKVFSSKSDWSVVLEYLERECGDNLPQVQTDYIDLVERIRFAVLKLSEGDVS